jgi:hypothetical protein
MRKIAQFGKYIWSLAIPPWTSFTLLHVSFIRPSSGRNIFARTYSIVNGSVIFRILVNGSVVWLSNWRVQRGATDWTAVAIFLGRVTDCSLFYSVESGSGAHRTSYPMGTEDSFKGLKQPVREASHSTPSAEVKNYEAMHPLHHVFMRYYLIIQVQEQI